MALDHPAGYGDTFAAVYDRWYHDVSDADATVRILAALTSGGKVDGTVHGKGGGTVLELGVGTGRLAIPLAATGVGVVGIDASSAMLAQCRTKPGSDAVTLVIADMAAPPLRHRFDVVFVAFNTLFNLRTERAQSDCVGAVGGLLCPTGSFVVEAAVPSPEPAHREYDESARSDRAGGRILRTAVRDPADQTVRGVHIHTDADGAVTRRPWTIRYLHPHQLDAMCAAAGLRLIERWADWDRSPFDSDCHDRHISIYRPEGSVSDTEPSSS